MCRSFSSAATLFFIGIALSGLIVNSADAAANRTAYPKTYFKNKSGSTYSATTHRPIVVPPATTYKPVAPTTTDRPALTTYKSPVAPAITYKPVVAQVTTTYKPAIVPAVKVGSYANTFFKSKLAQPSATYRRPAVVPLVPAYKPTAAPTTTTTTTYKPPAVAPVVTYNQPTVVAPVTYKPAVATPTAPAAPAKGLYKNTFFKSKASARKYNNNDDKPLTTSVATPTATTYKPSVVAPAKVHKPKDAAEKKKDKKKVVYTNTYFKIKSTEKPTAEKHVHKSHSNDSSSEESSEETHGLLGGSSESSEESSSKSSEEEGSGSSEEKEEEEESKEGEEEEESKENEEEEKSKEGEEEEESKEGDGDEKDDEKEEAEENGKDKEEEEEENGKDKKKEEDKKEEKKELVKQDDKKEEENKKEDKKEDKEGASKSGVKPVNKKEEAVTMAPAQPAKVIVVPAVAPEKKNTKPVFLAFKKMKKNFIPA